VAVPATSSNTVTITVTVLAAVLGVMSTTLTLIGARLYRRHKRQNRLLKEQRHGVDVFDNMSLASSASTLSRRSRASNYSDTSSNVDTLY
jgi:hypothetical protein